MSITNIEDLEKTDLPGCLYGFDESYLYKLDEDDEDTSVLNKDDHKEVVRLNTKEKSLHITAHDDRYFYGGLYQGMVRIWDKKDWSIVKDIEDMTIVLNLKLSEKFLFIALYHVIIPIIRRNTWEGEGRLEVFGSPTMGMEIVDNLIYLASAKYPQIAILNMDTWERVNFFEPGIPDRDFVGGLKVDEKYLYSTLTTRATNFGQLAVWDKNSLENVAMIENFYDGPQDHDDFDIDEKYIYMPSEKSIKIIEKETWEEVMVIKIGNKVANEVFIDTQNIYINLDDYTFTIISKDQILE